MESFCVVKIKRITEQWEYMAKDFEPATFDFRCRNCYTISHTSIQYLCDRTQYRSPLTIELKKAPVVHIVDDPARDNNTTMKKHNYREKLNNQYDIHLAYLHQPNLPSLPCLPPSLSLYQILSQEHCQTIIEKQIMKHPKHEPHS